MGKNFVQRLGYGNIAGLMLVAISVLMGTMMVTGAATGSPYLNNGNSNNASSTVTNAICNIFNTIKNVIFILGLALMVLGGAVYAGANLMPSQSRGGFQGYGMAMVIGGIIGVAIAVAAPYILGVILQASGGSGAFLANQSSTGTNYNTGTGTGSGGTSLITGNVNSVCNGSSTGGF